MLCDKCQKNPATVHIVKMINGDKKEINLCQSCAQANTEMVLTGGFLSPFSFQNILSGFVDYIGKNSQDNSTGIKCPSCGMSAEELKHTGLVGCEQCYKTFQNIINPIIQRVQGSTEHRGKFPKKESQELMSRKRMLKLKEELQKAIIAEEYEKAASLRDEIKSLQNNNE